MSLTANEINRKLLHLISGTLIPFSIFYLPVLKYLTVNEVLIIYFVLLLFSIFFELFRFKNTFFKKKIKKYFGVFLRKEEDFSLTGSTYIFASSFVCAFIFQRNLHIAFIVLNLFIIGDAAASIIGIKYGKIKINNKSFEGFLACFLSCFILMKFVYPFLPVLKDSVLIINKYEIMFIMSFVISILEMFPIKIFNFELNDNLTTPIISGIILLIFEKKLLG